MSVASILAGILTLAPFNVDLSNVRLKQEILKNSWLLIHCQATNDSMKALSAPALRWSKVIHGHDDEVDHHQYCALEIVALAIHEDVVH